MIWFSVLLLLIALIAFLLSLGLKDDDKTVSVFIGLIVGVIGLVLLSIASVAIIPPGNVGVQTTFGNVRKTPLLNGIHVVNPFSSIERVEIRTFEYTMSSSNNEGKIKGDDSVRLFSKDILPMDADITIMWRPVPAMVLWLYQHIGARRF